ncbi:MAG: 4Fe-4S dicluster domain-containing protein [Desulfovibrio sp.]|jgi:ferredoxin|nr:4Fe-4S dicluster domain-containing protein [Desulfovibrio sp.]
MNTDTAQKFVSFEALPAFLAKLAAGATLYAPRRENKAVVYRPWQAGDKVELSLRPTESCKHVVFPRSEELFSFDMGGDPEKPGKAGLTLQEASEPGPAVVFAALSCDARGFLAFDPVYDGCGTGGKAKDTYYLKRREKTTLIVRTCKSSLNTCFCTWVGGSPASSEGADALLTEINGGYLLEAVTDKGASLLASLPAASDEQSAASRAAREQAVQSAPQPPQDMIKAPAALGALFDSAAFWEKQSAHCIYCGACTYLCPTCYCFNITDESNGLKGLRMRSWDNCMSPLFTLETSGHNPRQEKANRLKNRVGHKFSYYPKIHSGRFSCCGCGRCIKSCPSSVDIRKIVLDAIKEAANV